MAQNKIKIADVGFQLSNSNGITFGTNGQTITASYNSTQFVGTGFSGTNISGTVNSNGIQLSVAPGGGGADGYNILAAGTQTANSTGTVAFVNSNGISFGMSNNSQITASYTVPTQSTQPVAYSAANGSANFSTLVFANSNGVSFSTGTQGVFATVKTDYQTSGAYLTTAMQSNRGSDFMGTNTALTANGVSMTANSSGLSLNFPAFLTTAQPVGAYLTTARASNDGVGLNTAQTNVTWTVNSSGISFNAGGYAGTGFATTTTNGSVVVGTHATNGMTLAVPPYLTTAQAPGAYLTTAAQSNQVVNSFNGSTGQISVNVGSSLSSSTNGSSITFGLASNITTALQSAGAYLTTAALSNHSHNFATTTTNGASIIVATTNSNGATIAVPAFLTTAQPVGAYLTTARASNDAIGLNTALTANGVSVTANSSGLSLNFPAFLTTAQPVGAYLTTARASNDAIGLNTAGTNVTWTVNSSGLSFNGAGYAGTGTSATNASVTLNSNGLAISVGAGGGVTPVASASNGSFSFTTLGFSNANNVTFGTSAGSIITASVAAPGAAAENNWVNLLGANTAGNTTASGSTIGYSGINLTLSGTNGSVVNISAPAVSSLSATGQVSISTNGSTISIGVPNPSTRSGYEPYINRPMVVGQQGNGSLQFDPDFMPNVQFDRVVFPMAMSNATNLSGSQTLSFWAGIYTRNASTLSLLYSASGSTAVTQSGTAGSYSLMSGMRNFTIPMTQTVTEGQYWLAFLSRTTSGGANASYSNFGVSQINSNFVGHFGSSHNTTYQKTLGRGVYTVTTSGMPASVAFSQIRGSDSIGQRPAAMMFASSTV